MDLMKSFFSTDADEIEEEKEEQFIKDSDV